MSRSTDDSQRKRRNHALWIGPLTVVSGVLSYFLLFARFPALRDFPWLNLPWVLLGLAITVVGLWRAHMRPEIFRGRWIGSLAVLFAVALAGLFHAYVFYISYLLPEPARTTIALTEAPDFELVDHSGRSVRLSDLRGRKVVLTFYRGFW